MHWLLRWRLWKSISISFVTLQCHTPVTFGDLINKIYYLFYPPAEEKGYYINGAKLVTSLICIFLPHEQPCNAISVWPRQKDLNDIAPLSLFQLYHLHEAWVWMTRQMSLRTHMQRMIIALFVLYHDWMISKQTIVYWTFNFLSNRSLCKWYPFVVVRQILGQGHSL